MLTEKLRNTGLDPAGGQATTGHDTGRSTSLSRQFLLFKNRGVMGSPGSERAPVHCSSCSSCSRSPTCSGGLCDKGPALDDGRDFIAHAVSSCESQVQVHPHLCSQKSSRSPFLLHLGHDLFTARSGFFSVTGDWKHEDTLSDSQKEPRLNHTERRLVPAVLGAGDLGADGAAVLVLGSLWLLHP